jgi:hypothetical protein
VLRDGDVGVGAGGGIEKATQRGLMMQRERWWTSKQGDLDMWTSQRGEGPHPTEARGVANPHHALPQAQPPPPLGRLPQWVQWRRELEGRRCVGRGWYRGREGEGHGHILLDLPRGTVEEEAAGTMEEAASAMAAGSGKGGAGRIRIAWCTQEG